MYEIQGKRRGGIVRIQTNLKMKVRHPRLKIVTISLIVHAFVLYLLPFGNANGDNGMAIPEGDNAAKPRIPIAEQLHLINLNRACNARKGYLISSSFDAETVDAGVDGLYGRDDPRLPELLARCPVIDVHMSEEDWNHGYCEDTMAYVKYLDTRIVPTWVYETAFNISGTPTTYFELCPHTAVLMMNHYWDGLPERPDWPSTKKLLVMPNPEMGHMRQNHYFRLNEVICKSRDCHARHLDWFRIWGNPQNARVWYTRHISTNLSLIADMKVSNGSIASLKQKNFGKGLYMMHSQGKSIFKGTSSIIRCWKHRPNLPHLNLVGADVKDRVQDEFKQEIVQRNLDYAQAKFSEVELSILHAEAPVQLCPSEMEGFGHYINQARAAGALLLTTDHAPMNELVTNETGVLVKGVVISGEGQMLGPGSGTNFGLEDWIGMHVQVPWQELCRGVDIIVKMSPEERQRRAEAVQKAYVEDALFFKASMKEMKKILAQEQLERMALEAAFSKVTLP
ncbi:hypothetical protein BC830DRAFT_855635 [Chytriomyces sp. MP71]|nr:hypothetical protein BC830DRAFT_855635 [Chytriomyces sp. MP71]